MGPKHVLSSDAKKCQQAFLAPLLGLGPKPVLSSDAKKCQQGQDVGAEPEDGVGGPVPKMEGLSKC
jgi:hypothetical protein